MTVKNNTKVLYSNSIGKKFEKRGDTIDLRSIKVDPSKTGKERIRGQITGWFDGRHRHGKKGEKMPVSQEEIDKSVEAFLKKGGKITKLEPGIARMVDDDEEESNEDKFDFSLSIEKLLSIKINEMKY